jgi:hypothetical protein
MADHKKIIDEAFERLGDMRIGPPMADALVTGLGVTFNGERIAPEDFFAPVMGTTCRDFDEDCDDIPDKVKCYLYDPAKGMCPYLRAQGKP